MVYVRFLSSPLSLYKQANKQNEPQTCILQLTLTLCTYRALGLFLLSVRLQRRFLTTARQLRRLNSKSRLCPCRTELRVCLQPSWPDFS